MILLARARGLTWVVEQPQSSLLEFHPRFQELFACTVVYRTRVTLGAYHAHTRKPLYLLSGDKWVEALSHRRLQRGHKFGRKTCRTSLDSTGKARVCGGKFLKASQTYPRKFGRAVAHHFLAHVHGRGGLVQPTPVQTPHRDRKFFCGCTRHVGRCRTCLSGGPTARPDSEWPVEGARRARGRCGF